MGPIMNMIWKLHWSKMLVRVTDDNVILGKKNCIAPILAGCGVTDNLRRSGRSYGALRYKYGYAVLS